MFIDVSENDLFISVLSHNHFNNGFYIFKSDFHTLGMKSCSRLIFNMTEVMLTI